MTDCRRSLAGHGGWAPRAMTTGTDLHNIFLEHRLGLGFLGQITLAAADDADRLGDYSHLTRLGWVSLPLPAVAAAGAPVVVRTPRVGLVASPLCQALVPSRAARATAPFTSLCCRNEPPKREWRAIMVPMRLPVTWRARSSASRARRSSSTAYIPALHNPSIATLVIHLAMSAPRRGRARAYLGSGFLGV